jgi:hypothetical protein
MHINGHFSRFWDGRFPKAGRRGARGMVTASPESLRLPAVNLRNTLQKPLLRLLAVTGSREAWVLAFRVQSVCDSFNYSPG